jgi:RNA-directed DNA polymerase
MSETTGNRRISMRVTNKPFHIEKRWVYEAYQAIRSNAKAAGVEGQTLEQFEADLSRDLYKIWWDAFGTYFPPPVRAVPFEKEWR